ncbi:putative disease resistance protein RGA3 [Glycine soja]|nr:putative disease resistance protein RGA3 [Glycine soja]
MDAKEANMSIKQLNTLWLSWDRNEESELHENVEEILEVLHLDVQQLLRLEVEEYLYEESYEGEVVFRALEELTLRWLPNLKRLSREDVENMFPRCSTLEIDDCPQFLSYNMAEFVLETLLGNLKSLVQKELLLFLGFDQDLERLSSLFTAIKATLEDAEEKQFSNRAIKDWLEKLKHEAHILDDIIDECAYEVFGLENQGVKCGPSNKVQGSCLSSFHPKRVVFRYKIAKKLKRISERLMEIAEERNKFHLVEMVREIRSGVLEWRQTTSLVIEPKVYGREEDKDKILDFLIGDASHFEDLFVYPITGLGGLGKTTLAQFIFNDEKVVNHFELRIWVCVSEDFSLERMTKAIIEATSGVACKDLDIGSKQKRLQTMLQRKRYLLVLDDVWDDKQENWQRLKSVLACGAKGASILVTTRQSKVAAIMGTIAPHELSVLPNKYCWELFKHQAFGPNEEEQVELEDIGKEIVKKCRGMPLAAKALGGLLRFKRNKNEWLNVKESNLLELSQNENSIIPVLRLSYMNLPIEHRQCFAYCSIFPKDESIGKQYLIELWMANGFISSDERLDVEDVGDRVWNELYHRSFFQDIEIDEFGKVTSFKMHDLVHDLALSIAQDVCCITEDNRVTNLSGRILHLSDHRSMRNVHEESIDALQLYLVKSLRTYILPDHYGDQLSPHPDVLKCHSLRVLDFVKRENLSSSIGLLKHLRYLNLSGGGFETLPGSLFKLWNLQILKLDRCRRLKMLPNSLICLKALQQLSFNGCQELSRLPPQIGKLTSLRILTKFFVGKERGFCLEELGSQKLKGDLDIKHLGNVKSVMDAKEANMSSKQLKKLRLSWDRNEDSELQENVEEILEVLQPDTQQLWRLEVEEYKGFHFPQWMSSQSLKYLTILYLMDCKNCLGLPLLGKLPSLKTIRIQNMIHVEYFYQESYDGEVVFRALEDLSLRQLPNLKMLSRQYGENMFPRFSILEIDGCPKFLGEEVLLHRLHSLSVISCGKFNLSAGFKCLQKLWISECKGVKNLQALQYMTSLKEIRLRNLHELESLPDCFGNLSLLHTLSIFHCSKLTCLPMSLSLSGLQQLTIFGCHSELEKRCEKETGKDWPNIAHIRHISVGSTLYDHISD